MKITRSFLKQWNVPLHSNFQNSKTAHSIHCCNSLSLKVSCTQFDASRYHYNCLGFDNSVRALLRSSINDSHILHTVQSRNQHSDNDQTFPNNLSKPRRIILMRHGQSLANLDKSIHTHTPDYKISLTKTGRAQAQKEGKALSALIPKNESVKFWVSPYYRTRETFEEVVKSFKNHTRVSYCEEVRLREQEWGNFQDEEEIRRVSQERWRYGPFYYRFPNGESGSDVYDRISAFLETLYRHFGREDNMILISHGLTCRLFLMRWYKWPVKLFHRLENLQNAQSIIMELQPDGKYKIKTAMLLRKNGEVGFPPNDFHEDILDKIHIQRNHEMDIHFNDDPAEDGIIFQNENEISGGSESSVPIINSETFRVVIDQKNHQSSSSK